MTPIEAAAAARELAEHFDRLARLDSHPTSNADAIYASWAEAGDIVDELKAHLAFFEVTV